MVYVKDEAKVFRIPDYPSCPAPVPLRLAEQRLILDFSERMEKLSGERRRELALLLADLVGRKEPENRLLAFGNWFLRGRASR